MAGSIDIVNNLYNEAQKQLSDLRTITEERDKAAAWMVELQRQYNYHLANGNGTDAAAVQTNFAPSQSKLDILNNNLKLKQASYDSAIKAYQDAKNNLLNADEQKQLLDKQAAETEALKTATDKQQQALYAQKNTKYMIYGGIAIVVIIVAIVIWKKFKK